jgi:putative NADH-flavin reductase
MKVLVLGANGKTGKLVVDQAVAMGHEVSVLVRKPSATPPSGVKVVVGDALNAEDVLKVIDKQEAVVDCIGGKAPWRKQTLEQDAMRNIVAAMKATEARRLLVVSAMGVAESAEQSPWWFRYLMVPTFLRGSTADKAAMEVIVKGSGLDYVIARPPILKDGEATGSVRVITERGKGHAITRADLAVWLVEQLDNRKYIGQAVVMVNS